MSDASMKAAGMEARQSLVRVWMAISAVWVTFWLLIATTAFAAAEVHPSFADDLPTFAFIVVAPPLGLLLLVVIGRSMFEASLPLLARVQLLETSRPSPQPTTRAASGQDQDAA